MKRVSLLELQLVVAAANREPEEVLDQVRLGLEDRADGRFGNAGCAGDVGEGRRPVTTTIAEGDYVIQYGKITSTWPGRPFRGYEIPAGDYQCDVAFMYRFENGRIAERWAVRDDLTMIKQLGGNPAHHAVA